MRLGCDCGKPQIVCCTDEDERIIFCKPCGTMTTEDQLRAAAPDGTNAGIPWSFENVGSSSELPLLNVSIPCTISSKMGADDETCANRLPGVLTKLSTERGFLRLGHADGDHSDRCALETDQYLRMEATQEPLDGETLARVEEVLQPHGPDGPCYYKVRFELMQPRRRRVLQAHYRQLSGLAPDCRVLVLTEHASAGRLIELIRQAIPSVHILKAKTPGEFRLLCQELQPNISILPGAREVHEKVGTIERLRGCWAHYIVLMVARNSTEATEQARSWGADDLLPDDCTLQEVRGLIRRGSPQRPTIISVSENAAVTRNPVRQPAAAEPPATMLEDDTIRMLCMASETHDKNISNHLKRIASYSAEISRHLGWDEAYVSRVAVASKLHDVGKIGVPDEILVKTGALTQEEREIMQHHTRLGYKILNDSNSALMRLGAIIALRHHERFDGGGYPDGLLGEAIPLEAQVVSVADVFDALTTSRPYKPAWDNEKTINYIVSNAGTMFNPRVVDAFLHALPEIRRHQLGFLDDFRDIWTERRIETRHVTDLVPVNLELAMPELTFRPYPLEGQLNNLSAGGIKLMLSNVTSDMHAQIVSVQRWAKIRCDDPQWQSLNETVCRVAWVDYHALPDPKSCLMGLQFQQAQPQVIESLEPPSDEHAPADRLAKVGVLNGRMAG